MMFEFGVAREGSGAYARLPEWAGLRHRVNRASQLNRERDPQPEERHRVISGLFPSFGGGGSQPAGRVTNLDAGLNLVPVLTPGPATAGVQNQTFRQQPVVIPPCPVVRCAGRWVRIRGMKR